MIEKFLVCFYSITKKSSSAHLIAPELLFCIHLKFDKLIYVLCISQFLLLTRSNPLATAAVVSVFQLFDQYHILSNVREMAAYLDTRLLKLLEETSLITEIRDLGLMKGIELTVPAAPYIKALQASGIIVIPSGTHVIRLLPPLIANSGLLRPVLRSKTAAMRSRAARVPFDLRTPHPS